MTCRNTFLFIPRNGILCPQFFGIYLFHPLDIAKNESFFGGFAPPATWANHRSVFNGIRFYATKHYVLKDIARYVLSYSKPLELLSVTSCQRVKKKSSFSFFRAQQMFEGTSKTLPCRVGSLSEVGLPMFQSDDSLCNSIIAACTT